VFESSSENVAPCSGKRCYHNGEVFLGDYDKELLPPDWEANATRLYPTQCDECPYIFEAGAHRSADLTPLWQREDTGELILLNEAPVGAMWLATWFPPSFGSPVHQSERPGQPHLIVKTPGGDWDVDAKSANGSGWSWSGTPPNVTASPSILIQSSLPEYHGWLRNGELVPA
jgi:hypothetical protein